MIPGGRLVEVGPFEIEFISVTANERWREAAEEIQNTHGTVGDK